MGFLNRVRVNVGTIGTGSLTAGSAYSANAMTLSEAGAVSGASYSYVLAEGNDFEVGYGVATFSSGAWTVTRNVRISKIGGIVSTTAKMSLAGNAVFTIDVTAEDYAGFLVGQNNLADLQNLSSALGNLGVLPLILPKTANYAAIAADRGKLISGSAPLGSTITIGTPAAASVGAGWGFLVENTDYGQVVIDPNGSETIDGRTTLNAFKGQPAFWVVSDGANWRTIGRATVFNVTSIPTFNNVASATLTLPDALNFLRVELLGLYPSATDILTMRLAQSGVLNTGANYVFSQTYTSSTALSVQGSTGGTFYPLGINQLAGNPAAGMTGGIICSRSAGLTFSAELSHYSTAIGSATKVGVGGYFNGGGFNQIVFASTSNQIGGSGINLIGTVI